KQEELGALIEGRISLALAWAEAQSRFDVSDVSTRATKVNNGYRLEGSKRWVLNGHAADTIVVSARTSGSDRDPQGISLFLVDRNTPRLNVQAVKTMDGHHAGMLTFDGVELPEARRLGAEGAALPAL